MRDAEIIHHQDETEQENEGAPKHARRVAVRKNAEETQRDQYGRSDEPKSNVDGKNPLLTEQENRSDGDQYEAGDCAPRGAIRIHGSLFLSPNFQNDAKTLS
jgi:hypothetical protein